MVGTPTIRNAEVRGNGVGVLAATSATPTAATVARHQKFKGKEGTVWSALTAAVNMFGRQQQCRSFLKTAEMAGICQGGVNQMRYV